MQFEKHLNARELHAKYLRIAHDSNTNCNMLDLFSRKL